MSSHSPQSAGRAPLSLSQAINRSKNNNKSINILEPSGKRCMCRTPAAPYAHAAHISHSPISSTPRALSLQGRGAHPVSALAVNHAVHTASHAPCGEPLTWGCWRPAVRRIPTLPNYRRTSGCSAPARRAACCATLGARRSPPPRPRPAAPQSRPAEAARRRRGPPAPPQERARAWLPPAWAPGQG